jgi:hypothetical protein
MRDASVSGKLRGARSALARVRRRFSHADESRYVRLGEGTADTATPLPAGAAEQLVHDNPRLVELRRRYAASTSTSPISGGTTPTFGSNAAWVISG